MLRIILGSRMCLEQSQKVIDINKTILVIMSLLGITLGFSQIHDVGCTKLEIPPSTLLPGQIVTPACSVYNFGDYIDTFVVRMKIGTVYEETETVMGLNPGTYTYLTFLNWVAVTGTYTVSCSTELITDINNTNDRQTGSIHVTVGWIYWPTMAPIPTTPSGRKPKSGTCMAGLEATGKIYFLKASNTPDFAEYIPDPSGVTPGTWNILETMPKGSAGSGDGKNPKHGAAIAAYEPNKSVYVLRGNNTVGFWQYQAETVTGTDTIGWKKRANIPGKFKRCKYKSGLVAVTKEGNDFLFCMKGANTNEFYLYDIAYDTWLEAKSPPIGASGRTGYKRGSCLCYDGSQYVYVLQGYYGSFFKYQVETDSWIELSRYNYKTYLNRDGKKKKPKDGAGLVYQNYYVYMLKGGNTRELWKYNTFSNTGPWVQKNPDVIWDIPLGGGKQVGGGGCITKFGDYDNFYVIKGNNTTEFYGHGAPVESATANVKQMKEESIKGKPIGINNCQFSIAPNPARSFLAVRWKCTRFGQSANRTELKIFDVSGKVVKVTSAQSHKQEIKISLKGIKPGIYFLKAGKETKKFLVVR